jgi:protein O-GlcNAc transferase
MSSPETDPLWTEAQAAWEEGLFDTAGFKLEKLLKTHPHSAPVLALLGQVAQAKRSWKEARKRYQQALDIEPSNPDYTHLMGQWLLERQQPTQAEALYAEFLTQYPQYPVLRVEYASLLGQRGEFALAEQELRTSLDANPLQLDALLLLGNLATAQGNFAEAETAYKKILNAQPKLPEVHRRLGQLYLYQGHLSHSQNSFEAALELDREDAESWSNLGAVLLMQAQTQNQRSAAIRACMQGLLRSPRNANIFANIGIGFFQMNLYREALFYLDRAQSIDSQLQIGDFEIGMSLFKLGKPGHALEYLQRSLQVASEPPENLAQLEASLGYIFAQRGNLVQAEKHYRAGHALDSNQAGQWLAGSLLPPIAPSLSAWNDYAKHYRNALCKLEASPPLCSQIPIDMPGIFWAYQAENVRPEQEQQARIWQAALAGQLSASKQAARSSAPWRIGLVSRYFYNHSVMHVFAGLIQALAQDGQFEIRLFSLGPAAEDQTTLFLNSLQIHTQDLSGLSLTAASEAILEQKLDLLLYPELGMDPLTFALACSKLATYQGVLSGHPITTGLNTIDWYFSSSWLETEQAQSAYSEELVLLDELLPDFPFPALPQNWKRRSELGLSKRRVYLCPMMLFKIHPLMDSAFAQILAQDPQAEIVFFQYPQGSLHDGLDQLLLKRWAQSIPDFKRLRFLPWATREDLLRLIHHADVVLDSFPFGGGNTSYLTLAVGTPLVTLANPFLRGRSSTGMYQRMGLSEIPAKDTSDYVAKALKWANDPQAREELQAKIVEKRGILFDNPAGSAALIAFLKDRLQGSV